VVRGGGGGGTSMPMLQEGTDSSITWKQIIGLSCK
jgi:hypothetical protein